MTQTKITSLLLIEDNLGDARHLREMLKEQRPHSTNLVHVQSMAEAEAHLATNVVDVILLDLGLPDAQGVDAVRRAHAAAPRVPLVVLTGLDDEDMAGLALQEGAQGYLIKGQIETRGLLRALRYAIERNIMEEALFVEHERAQVTLDCIADAVACTDVSGDITFLNRVAETMTGWPAKSAIGRPMADVFCVVNSSSSQIERTIDPLLRAIRTGETIGLANDVFRHANGTTFAVEYSSAPMRDSAGTLIGAVVAMRDISERRAMERLKNEFVSTVSHELRTPLTSIRGALGLLSSGMLGDITEKGRRMLDIAVANTDRLVRLINDILDIERLDSGKIELVRTVVDAHQLMAQAIEGVQAIADSAEVELTLEAGTAQLLVDSDRILQTLTNLLGNAIKFSPAGTCVTLSGKSQNGVFTVRVADRGRGIPEDKVNLVFERFKQVDASDSRDKGGSGLGLAISSSIICAHGGKIWTEKNGDQGSVFLFTIPLSEAAVGGRTAPADEVEVGFEALIVEDDEDLYRVMSASLQKHGVRTVQAATGEEALEAFRTRRFDLMVLDLALPAMDGFEVIAVLRQDHASPAIPLLVYSAMEVSVADQHRLCLGPTAFLTKSKVSLQDFAMQVMGLLANPARTIGAMERRSASHGRRSGDDGVTSHGVRTKECGLSSPPRADVQVRPPSAHAATLTRAPGRGRPGAAD